VVENAAKEFRQYATKPHHVALTAEKLWGFKNSEVVRCVAGGFIGGAVNCSLRRELASAGRAPPGDDDTAPHYRTARGIRTARKRSRPCRYLSFPRSSFGVPPLS
jgi:hypothetical protein